MIDLTNVDSVHTAAEPSHWVMRWASLLAVGAEVLDVACGNGRHARYLAARGFRVTAVDRDARATAYLKGAPNMTIVTADLEADAWPFADRIFDGIVVTNYLHRPLFAPMIDGLGSGGLLIYETFAAGNERFGRPSNPEFLLQPGELLDATRDAFHVVAYEDVFVEQPRPAMVQRLCARRF